MVYVGHQAAVHDELAAGGVGGLVTGEEHHERRDLPHFARTAQRDGDQVFRQVRGHRGTDEAGVDRVHPDVVRRQLQSRGLGQAAHPPLRRDIRVYGRRAAQSLDRGHVDDRATASSDHRLDRHPHAQECAGQVDVNYLLPLGQIEVLQLPERDGAGVVDQHVELAELAGGDRDRGFPLVGLGDVEVHVARGVTDLVGQRLALVIEDVADHHLGAFRDEQARIFGAHPACAATDERDLSLYPSGSFH